MITFKSGYKYQLCAAWTWDIKEPITVNKNYSNSYYWITTDGKMGAYPGCAWDGPTWCPDFDIFMESSLAHDIFHWLIARGVIPESDNDLIDKEFETITKEKGPKPSFFGITGKKTAIIMARLARRGTNLVNQKKGKLKKIHIIGA